jgi:hypothetical protein
VGVLQTQWVPVRVGFDPVIGHDTRAEESVPFPAERTFNVWAVSAAGGEVYIDDETISCGSDGWLSATIWPHDELSFHAYSPSDLNPQFSKKDGLTIKDFDCSGGHVDILVAKTGNIGQDADSLVILPFEHALSRVEFRMQQSLDSQISVRLRKIEMIGFASKGTYNSRKSTPWEIGPKDFSYVVYDDPVGHELTSTPIYIGEEFYTIPQLCSARIEVTFEIKFGDAAWIPQVEEIKELDTNWEPNTHYTFTLNLTETKLTHTTGISNWNNRD